MEIEDIKSVITYFETKGSDIYGTKYLGYDAGKDNLVSHFCTTLKWSKAKLKSIITYMEDKLILIHHPKQSYTTRLLSLSMIMKLDSHLKL